MTSSIPCPLCGGEKGYTLHEGSSYRWWWVRCAACGSDLAECASDRRTTTGEPLSARWPSADQAWAEQGAHAQSLRVQLHHMESALAAEAEDAARYRWLRDHACTRQANAQGPIYRIDVPIVAGSKWTLDAAIAAAMKDMS